MSAAPIGLVVTVCLVVWAAVCIGHGQATDCHSCSGQACLRTSQVGITKQCLLVNDMCASLFDGFVPRLKGCYSELSDDDKTECDTSGSVNCYKCSGDRCNNLGRIDHKCKQCVGTSSNSTCLMSPALVPDTRCTAPRTLDVYCSVRYEGNTTTRACLNSNRDILECQQAPEKCSMCMVNSMGGCNVGDFPANRRKCLYCVGDNCQNANVTTTAAVLRTCPNAADRCVSVNLSGSFRRRCAEELAVEESAHCGAHNTSCVYCSTNGCNVAVPPSGVAAVAANVAVLSAVVMLGLAWSSA